MSNEVKTLETLQVEFNEFIKPFGLQQFVLIGLTTDNQVAIIDSNGNAQSFVNIMAMGLRLGLESWDKRIAEKLEEEKAKRAEELKAATEAELAKEPVVSSTLPTLDEVIPAEAVAE